MALSICFGGMSVVTGAGEVGAPPAAPAAAFLPPLVAAPPFLVFLTFGFLATGASFLVAVFLGVVFGVAGGLVVSSAFFSGVLLLSSAAGFAGGFFSGVLDLVSAALVVASTFFSGVLLFSSAAGLVACFFSVVLLLTSAAGSGLASVLVASFYSGIALAFLSYFTVVFFFSSL